MATRGLPVNSDVEYTNYRTFQTVCNRAKENIAKAVTADETRTEKKGVILLYKKAISDILAALRIRPCSCPPNKRDEINCEHEKLNRHLELVQDRLSKLEEQIDSGTSHAIAIVRPLCQQTPISAISMPSVSVSAKRPAKDKSALLKNVNPKFGEELLATILPTSDTTMGSVEGNAAAKMALEESVVLPALNPKLFTGLRAPCKGILLFGPPGNGKTMLAKAVANECQSTFFNISAATIMSKWVGDGERMVQALFQIARNAQPSIIFIGLKLANQWERPSKTLDEVDSMLCERSEHENAAARRVKTEFLIQLDGCSGKSDDRVLVLAATNRPHELDEGILRRFPKRVFIDLPDRIARAKMIRRTFVDSNTPSALKTKELDYLAAHTEGYSYSDLDALCRSAALIPLRSYSRSMVSRMTTSQLRPVNIGDFEEALLAVKPSLNQENRQRLLEFASKHAQMPVQ